MKKDKVVLSRKEMINFIIEKLQKTDLKKLENIFIIVSKYIR